MTGVTIAQMRLLAAFQAHASLGAVARELGLSQPTVSANLSSLEAKLGLQLVERSATGSRLTEQGRMVATWARGLIRESDDLDRLLADLRAGSRGRLRVAASMTVAEYLMPHWLLRAVGGQPALGGEVELTVANSEHVMESVHSRTADLGFVEGLSLRPGLRSATVGHDHLTVIVRPEHAWARLRRISPDQLLDGDLIVREPGSGTREVLERALAAIGGRLPERTATMGSTSAIKTSVRASDAAGVVSRLAVRDELKLGTLVAVDVTGIELTRRLRAVWTGDVARDPRMPRLIATARASAPDSA